MINKLREYSKSQIQRLVISLPIVLIVAALLQSAFWFRGFPEPTALFALAENHKGFEQHYGKAELCHCKEIYSDDISGSEKVLEWRWECLVCAKNDSTRRPSAVLIATEAPNRSGEFLWRVESYRNRIANGLFVAE